MKACVDIKRMYVPLYSSLHPMKHFTKCFRLVLVTLSLPPPHLPSQFRSSLPGPGNYGKGGIPWAAMEEKALRSSGTVGMLAAGGSHLHTLPTRGSDLPPGQYHHTSPIKELLDKRISKRGPYDLYTGERYKPPKLLVCVA